MQRHRRHVAGDHSLCRRCAAVRAEDAADVLAAAPVPADLDVPGELRAAAARLVGAHEREPANAIVARELRLTLEVLAKLEPVLSDPMDELRAIAAGVS